MGGRRMYWLVKHEAKGQDRKKQEGGTRTTESQPQTEGGTMIWRRWVD